MKTWKHGFSSEICIPTVAAEGGEEGGREAEGRGAASAE